jgi:hypothetical protein
MRQSSPSPTTSLPSGVVVLNQQQTDSCGVGAIPASAVTPYRASADLTLPIADSGLGSSAGGVGRATTATTPTPAG